MEGKACRLALQVSQRGKSGEMLRPGLGRLAGWTELDCDGGGDDLTTGFFGPGVVTFGLFGEKTCPMPSCLIKVLPPIRVDIHHFHVGEPGWIRGFCPRYRWMEWKITNTCQHPSSTKMDGAARILPNLRSSSQPPGSNLSPTLRGREGMEGKKAKALFLVVVAMAVPLNMSTRFTWHLGNQFAPSE
jgi:hypothetical protein